MDVCNDNLPLQTNIWHLLNLSFFSTVGEVGEDVKCLLNDEAIVMMNHQTTADVPTLMYAFSQFGNLCRSMMWIQDMVFKYSQFGWVSLVHGDFFVLQVRNDCNITSLD